MGICKPSITFVVVLAFTTPLFSQPKDNFRVWSQKNQVYHDSSLTVFIEYSYPDKESCTNNNSSVIYRFTANGNRKNDIKSIPVAFDFINCSGITETRFISLDLVLIDRKRTLFKDSYSYLGKKAINVRLEEPPRPDRNIIIPVEENNDNTLPIPAKPETPSPNVPY